MTAKIKLDELRGLLCQVCNHALGLLDEDPKRVKALLKYIEEHVLSHEYKDKNS